MMSLFRRAARPARAASRAPSPARAASRAGGLLALVMLSASCSSDASSSAAADLGPDTPVVGACRVLTAADVSAATNATPTVGCRSAHTSVTIGVGAFPSWRITSTNLTSGALGDLALQRCTTMWQRTVGGDAAAQHTTVVGLAFFLPDSEQLGRGARWFRCDLVIGGRDGMALADLPADVQGLLAGPLPDSLRACRTAPDFTRGRQVSCTRPHVLRAIGVAPLPDRSTYPGAQTLQRQSSEGCLPVSKRWLHGRIGAGTAVQWPDRTGWTLLHDRSAICWAVTVS